MLILFRNRPLPAENAVNPVIDIGFPLGRRACTMEDVENFARHGEYDCRIRKRSRLRKLNSKLNSQWISIHTSSTETDPSPPFFNHERPFISIRTLTEKFQFYDIFF